MWANFITSIGIILAVVVVGLVVAILVILFSVLRLLMKQAELKLEADPMANPFELDKEHCAKE